MAAWQGEPEIAAQLLLAGKGVRRDPALLSSGGLDTVLCNDAHRYLALQGTLQDARRFPRYAPNGGSRRSPTSSQTSCSW